MGVRQQLIYFILFSCNLIKQNINKGRIVMKSYLLVFAFVTVSALNVMAQPDFTAYTAGNPVIPRGTAGSWESGTVWTPRVTVVNDTIYMVYNGTTNFQSQPTKLGLAISTDGYNFSKSPFNPIFSADGTGLDANSVGQGFLFHDNGTWYLYYGGSATAANKPPKIISWATADNPHGPWMRTNDTLLTGGSNGEWDDRVTCPLQIFPTDTGLVMYYWGTDDWYPNVYKSQIGLATSTDGGQTWQKYDNPETNYPPYAESDPVLKVGIAGSYDDDGIFLAGIVKNSVQWEMFYAGFSTNSELGGICYATSIDGVNWQKYSENPIFTFWDDPLATYGYLECPSVVLRGNIYFLYYDYGTGPNGIGLATALRLPKVLNVPRDFTTIQAAINAAIDGDTVLVADSTYYENINFKSKAITVASTFILDQDASHISKTIINGSQASHPDSGSVVYFISGEDTNSVLCGFTITGGTGTISGNMSKSGGGIACRNSGAKIMHNIIENNHVTSGTPATPGGGISGGPLNDISLIVIENNTIRYNSTTNTAIEGEAIGGGISLVANARIINNIIEFNTAQSNDGTAYGGGVALINNQPLDRYVIGNKIWYNKALNTTGTYIYGGGVAGGLFVGDMPRAEIRLNDIRYNEIESNAGLNIDCWGGGVCLTNQNEETIFAQNYVAFNKAINNSPCNGAGMAIWNYDVTGAPQLINNIISNNTGGTWGGGLFTGGLVSSAATLVNNTICDNSATEGGSIFIGYEATNPSHPIIANSILWNNSSSIYIKTGSSVTVQFSDVEGGYAGTGNIDTDPLFYDSVLTAGDTIFCCLQANSPCIDMGDPATVYNDPQDSNNPGFAQWPARGGLRNDMGAYGGVADVIYGYIVGIEEDEDKVNQFPEKYKLMQNYPNPFNPKTTICYAVGEIQDSPVHVDLSIYNLLGQKVATLISEKQRPGTYKAEWNASGFASGVYFYRLQTDTFSQTRKLVLIR
jgi:predicted GH43/DUF377 family glycosyl hydrolase